MIEPGIEPMYVRRWPRISDSSRTPPTDSRTNLRPSAFAIEWPSDVLPTPGRPDEAEDLARHLVAQLRDGEVLDDPVLDLLEVEVVGVEHLARVLEIEVVLGVRRPGDGEDPLEVRADDAVLGRGRRELLEPLQLAVGGLAHLLGQLAERVEPLAQLGDLRLLGVVLAELLLDRLQLLAQEVLALALLHLRLDLRLDLRSELEHLELAAQDRRDRAQALLDVHLLEDLLALLGLDRAERRGDEMTERARIVDVRGGELQLLGQVRREADDAREEALHVAGQGLELRRLLEHVGERAELAEQVGVDVEAVLEPHALDALDEDAQRPVGDLDHLVHERDRPDVVDVVPAGRLDRRRPSR